MALPRSKVTFGNDDDKDSLDEHRQKADKRGSRIGKGIQSIAAPQTADQETVQKHMDFIIKRMNTATVKMIKGKKQLDDLLKNNLKTENNLENIMISNDHSDMNMKEILDSMDHKELDEYMQRLEMA